MSQLQSLTEEQQLLRRRARRRLIGALTLVLVAIIALPLLMANKPQTQATSVNIDFPDQDAANLPPLNQPLPPAEISASKVSSSNTVEPLSSAAFEMDDSEPPLVTEKPASHPNASGTLKKPANKPAKPAAATHQPPEKDPILVAAGELQNKPPKPAPNGTKFMVQFGALGDLAKANALKEKLAGLGIAAFVVTHKTATGEIHKVRAGPFADRAAALSAKNKSGLPAIVVGE